MLPLRELQLRFAAALFDGTPGAPLPWILEDGIAAEARLAVYRNNLREGFRKALALEFPVIERLVGADYFRALALEFLRLHPSRSGNLHHIGEPFPKFLAERFHDSAYPYLADVARLEWAYQDSLVAPEAEPLDPAAFLRFCSEAFPRLRLTLHPACRLVHSPYPILRIWRSNQPGAAEEIVDLQSGADSLLIRRVPDGAEFHRLPRATLVLLAALAEGGTLGAAYDAGRAADAGFEVGAALRHVIALGALTGVRLGRARPRGDSP
jgi:hypothetical protein